MNLETNNVYGLSRNYVCFLAHRSGLTAEQIDNILNSTKNSRVLYLVAVMRINDIPVKKLQGSLLHKNWNSQLWKVLKLNPKRYRLIMKLGKGDAEDAIVFYVNPSCKKQVYQFVYDKQFAS